MAAPNRLSVDEEFRNANYTPTWGVRNAEVTRATTGITPGRAANTPNRPRRRFENEAINQYTESTKATNSNYAPQTPEVSPREQNQRGFIAETITANVARVRAVPVAAMISAWALPCYFFFILPLGLFASMALGAAFVVEYYMNTTGGTVAEAIIQQLYGLDFSAFMVVYLGLSGIICFFNWIQIIIGSIQFKAFFIKPWFGRGTAFKTGSIILIMIGSFVPLLQLFPLIGLWVFAVVTNPK
jgi:hypothetical protein